MEIADIHEARSQLPELVGRAMNGEEVIIGEGGQWKGRVRMAEDFDTLPDDIAAAFGIIPARRDLLDVHRPKGE